MAGRDGRSYGPWILQSPKDVAVLDAEGEDFEPTMRLFCIPQAGMGAWAFHGWQEALGPAIEVMPIELPGRNSRVRERRYTDMRALVRDLVQALLNEFRRLPFCILGHSLGAWIAYELVQELRKAHEPLPLKLYVSANRAPSLHRKEHDVDPIRLSGLGYDAFWDAFFRRYGRNKDLESEGIRKFLYPMLKDDFAMLEHYEPDGACKEALPVPIEAFGAKEDNRYTDAQLMAWKNHTSVDFRSRWFDGPHRYIVDRPEDVRAYMASDLFGVGAL